jgi:hypothetical protein
MPPFCLPLQQEVYQNTANAFEQDIHIFAHSCMLIYSKAPPMHAEARKRSTRSVEHLPSVSVRRPPFFVAWRPMDFGIQQPNFVLD